MRSSALANPFLSLDVVRVRSTDSTEPVVRAVKSTLEQQSSPIPNRPTPDRQQQPWRTKDQSSIFRSLPASEKEIPDVFSIKRCLAFDDDE